MRDIIKSWEIKKNFITLSAYINVVRIARALRPYKRSRHFSAAIVTQKEPNFFGIMKAYLRAKEHVDDVQYRIDDLIICQELKINCVDLTSSSPKNALEDFVLGGDQNFAYMYDESASSEVCASCDIVLKIMPVTARDIQIAVLHFFGKRIDEDRAHFMLQHIDAIDKVFYKGRPFDRAWNAFQKLHALKNREHEEPVKPVEIDRSLKLENLKGYGPALDWGIDLARDLADYKKGLIAWEQLSKGLLLSGPPGCGKTTFAKALAAQCDVPLIVGSYGEWQSYGHQGDMLKAMRKAFELARKQAPCILFIDEIDDFTDREKHGDYGNDYNRNIVNALLQSLDGANGREGIVVIGACNQPDLVDKALKRSGRLDTHIVIPLPDAEARLGILAHHLKTLGSSLTMSPSAKQELTELVNATIGMSGADLEKIVRDAARLARKERRPISTSDLHACMPKLIRFTDEYVYSTAVHEVGHAIACAVHGQKMDHIRITNFVRDDEKSPAVSIGRVQINTKTIINCDRDHHLNIISVFLAGSAAEEVIYGRSFDGRINDLAIATATATKLEVMMGYGRTLICDGQTLDEGDLTTLRMRDTDLRDRVHETLETQMKRTKQIMLLHKSSLIKLAKKLAKELSLDPAEVIAEIKQAEKNPLNVEKHKGINEKIDFIDSISDLVADKETTA